MGWSDADVVVVGAGIVGLTVARELRLRGPGSRIVLMEKEKTLGCHASGRNSGVLHSGIYYPAGSLKARLCTRGAREMAAWCDERGLPIRRVGKVVVPRDEVAAESDLPLFYERATTLGVPASLVDARQLKEIEPAVRPGMALHLPETAVIDPRAVIASLSEELLEGGDTEIHYGERVISVDDWFDDAREVEWVPGDQGRGWVWIVVWILLALSPVGLSALSLFVLSPYINRFVSGLLGI